VLEPVNGGRRLRAPHHMLIDPASANAPVLPSPSLLYHPGELVRIGSGKYAGLWVVLADKGADKVNLAKLGGDDGNYLRASRHALVRVDPAAVLVPESGA
jgi:hypothetical protein